MSPARYERRLLLVHAHPDDETIGDGATMAKYAAEGALVALVTCTRGELGEIIPAGLAHLAAGREDRLGEYREGELAAACAALGVTDRRFLGGPGRWRDSGMMGTPDNSAPGCFWQADAEAAAAELAAVIREVRPQVMVLYDEYGGYGHPDHIQAHRVALRAVKLAAEPRAGVPALAGQAGPALPEPGPWSVTKLYATHATPAGRATTEIDATRYLPAKLAAMRAHATQISVDGQYFALSDRVPRLALGREFYTLLATANGASFRAIGSRAVREDDLFAGIA